MWAHVNVAFYKNQWFSSGLAVICNRNLIQLCEGCMNFQYDII